MTATPRKRFYHFSYLRQPLDAAPRIYDLRDGDAFAELEPVLLGLGYEYGGVLLNQPPDSGPGLLPRLGREDIVVLTMRPPLDDDETFDSKTIPRTDSDLEKLILRAARDVFKTCKRSLIQLQAEVARQLPPDTADRAAIRFRVYKSDDHKFAYYKTLKHPSGTTRQAKSFHKPPNPKTTAAFLLKVSLEPGGPTLINAFGVEGITTLLWCHLLRTKYAYLLEVPGFTMAEISAGDLPPQPLDLSFVDSWQVRLLLTPEEASSGRRREVI